MTDPNRELRLEEMPQPPLFKLTDEGADIFERTEVGGESANVGAVFSARELAEEFSEESGAFGMPAFSNLEAEELPDSGAILAYATILGLDFILVVTESGTGLFHADDVAARFSDESGDDFAFPLHFFTDESGESPLIAVEDGGMLVAALFTSPEKAERFRERASHLGLPDTLGSIWDPDGLSRHARVAERAGAQYAVIDPEVGTTEAIPLEELVREPGG